MIIKRSSRFQHTDLFQFNESHFGDKSIPQGMLFLFSLILDNVNVRKWMNNELLVMVIDYRLSVIENHVVALPVQKVSMRLYCLRMSDSVLIVGNGGVKNSKTYEEDPELNGYVIDLQRLDRLLKEEIKQGSVTIEEADINGINNKIFEI